MTLDGGSGGYYGPIKSVEGNIITIPEDVEPINGLKTTGMAEESILLTGREPGSSDVSAAIL